MYESRDQHIGRASSRHLFHTTDRQCMHGSLSISFNAFHGCNLVLGPLPPPTWHGNEASMIQQCALQVGSYWISTKHIYLVAQSGTLGGSMFYGTYCKQYVGNKAILGSYLKATSQLFDSYLQGTHNYTTLLDHISLVPRSCGTRKLAWGRG